MDGDDDSLLNLDVGGGGDDDDVGENEGENENERRRNRPRLNPPPPENPQPERPRALAPRVAYDGLIRLEDEPWVPKLPFVLSNVRTNTSVFASIKSVEQITGIAVDESDDSADEVDHYDFELKSLSNIHSLGANYDSQSKTLLVGICLRIKIVQNGYQQTSIRNVRQAGRSYTQVPGNQRILTVLCPQSPGENNIFVIIEAHNPMNGSRLFANDPTTRDNGHLRTGCLILVRQPVVRNALANGTSIVESNLGLVCVQPNLVYPERIPSANSTSQQGVILNNCTVSLQLVNSTTCNCTGQMCDLQPFGGGYGSAIPNKCACFRGNNRGSQVICTCNLRIQKDDIELVAEGFSSRVFCHNFLFDGNPVDLRANHIDSNTEYVMKHIRRVLSVVNEGGGWTVVGWSRQGTVEDQGGLTANQGGNQGNAPRGQQIEAGHANFHLVVLVPTNPGQVDRERLDRKKINIARLINNGN